MAKLGATGTIEGTISHETVTMPQPDLRSGIRLDSAMRAMRAQAKSTSTRAPLGATGLAKVRAVSDWLVKRCPPQSRRDSSS